MSMAEWFNAPFFAFLGLNLLVFGTAEAVQRLTAVSANLSRKVIHVLAGILAAQMPWYLSWQQFVLLSVLFSAFLVLSHLTELLHALHKVDRDTWGEVLFAVAAGVCAVLVLPESPEAFSFAFYVLAFADAAAELVGKHMKRYNRRLFGSKTLAGTSAFVLVTLLVALVMGAPLGLALLGGAVLVGISELLLSRGWDNLAIPVASALLWGYL